MRSTFAGFSLTPCLPPYNLNNKTDQTSAMSLAMAACRRALLALALC